MGDLKERADGEKLNCSFMNRRNIIQIQEQEDYNTNIYTAENTDLITHQNHDRKRYSYILSN